MKIKLQDETILEAIEVTERQYGEGEITLSIILQANYDLATITKMFVKENIGVISVIDDNMLTQTLKGYTKVRIIVNEYSGDFLKNKITITLEKGE